MKGPRICPHAGKLLLSALAVSLLASASQASSGDDNWDGSFGVPGANGPIYSMLISGNELFVGGSFTQIGGIDATNIARFDGTNWFRLGSGLTGGIFPVVLALANWDGELYAGGSFLQSGSVAVNRIARWDGSTWKPLETGLNGIVRALAASDSKLSVGGSFNSAGGVPTSNIAQWDGTNWTTLGSGVAWPYPGGAVDSLSFAGSTLYAGGRFRMAGGVAATNIAKWNGLVWSPLGYGLRYYDGPGSENGVVRAILATEDGIFAAGDFGKAGGMDASGIARWDGTQWFSLGSGVYSSRALVSNGSDIFLGGDYLSVSGIPANNIAKWDGISWSALGNGVEGGVEGGAVWSMVSSGSELYVGGPFGLAGGKISNYMGLWHIPHPLSIHWTGTDVALSWPATGTNFVLEAASDLGEANWQGVSGTPSIVNDQCVVTLAPGPGHQFFRLRRR